MIVGKGAFRVSIPSRGFWFFEGDIRDDFADFVNYLVSIPSRGFWFFEAGTLPSTVSALVMEVVSIPSRGFWFFEGTFQQKKDQACKPPRRFNPLAGILVF